MAIQKNIRVADILNGSVIATEEGWRAVAELVTRYEALLTKLDADVGVTGTDYAAGTPALNRRIVD